MIGKLICWMLRAHAWRRLRKAEGAKMPVELLLKEPDGPTPSFRICGRCGATKTVKTRTRKVAQ